MNDDLERLQSHLHHLLEVADAPTPCDELTAVAAMVLEAGEAEQTGLGSGMAFVSVLGAVREGSRTAAGLQQHRCNPVLVAGVAERVNRLRAAALQWWRDATDDARAREVQVAGEAVDEYERVIVALEQSGATEEHLGDLQRLRDLLDPLAAMFADDPHLGPLVTEIARLDGRCQATLPRALRAVPLGMLRDHEAQVQYLGVQSGAWWHYLARFTAEGP